MIETKTKTWHMGLVQGEPPTLCWIQLDRFNPDVNIELKATMPRPFRWHGESKRWILPLSWETCKKARELANKFGADLKVTDPMFDWATKEKARQGKIPDVNSMALTDLPHVRSDYPDMWGALSSRPFQTVGAAFAAHNRSCLIADQPGLGKTLQSIGAVIEAGIVGPVLVVAPKAAARLTWPQEIARWLGTNETVVIIGSDNPPAARRQLLLEAINISQYRRVWVITSPNYLRIKAQMDAYGKYVYDPETKKKIIQPSGEALMEFFDVQWSAVIVDESHQTLACATGNLKKQSAQRQGLGAINVRHNGLRLALSGTPFRGKEVYIWGQLNWLRPDLYTSYWKGFVEKYFDVWRDRYGMQIGRLVHPEAMYQEAKQVMIRRTKAEVAKDLPAKMYGGWQLEPGNPESLVAVWLEMEGPQKKAYDDMVRTAAAELEGGQLLANGVLAEMTRLKQFAGSTGRMTDDGFQASLPSNKFDWLMEFLDERGISKDLDEDAPKIVVTSQFKQLINMIHHGLKDQGIASYRFTGDTKDEDREAIKKDWQENPESKVRVLLLTTTAGGVSLTLDAASELVMMDETWNPADQEQVEDRLHRLSRIHQVTIWKVFSKGTIEESIAYSNYLRDSNIKDIIDGQRGIEIAKELLKCG